MTASDPADPNDHLPFGRYKSFPEFIYGITREIWEDRGLGSKIREYYSPDVVVRTCAGITVGNEPVTVHTIEALHQFPDRQLIGEDIIWASTAGSGFLSSHRLTSVMTHTADGMLGVARRNPIRIRAIADCWVQDQQVKEEWLVRDEAAFARCLGLETRELARQILDRQIRLGVETTFFSPALDRPSRYRPVIAQDADVQRYCEALAAIWNGRHTSVIRHLYFSGVALHGPGAESFHGHAEIDRLVLSYLGAFPDLEFRIESATVNREAEMPVRIAVRWSLTGRHTGFGRFGEPSGAQIYTMGISHAHMTAGQIRQEWMVCDEVSIWKQILVHRGVPATTSPAAASGGSHMNHVEK